MSANTHAGNVFVIRDLDFWPFDPEISESLGLVMKHFCVKFGWSYLRRFLRYRVEKKTDKHGCKPLNPTPATVVGIWVWIILPACQIPAV